MTGRVLLDHFPAPDARAVLLFDDTILSFCDPRGFGTLEVVELERFGTGLGPDLFELERERFTETAPPALGRSRRAVKALLLDQSLIAGIGNYLADEALWEQRIAPQAPASAIDGELWAGLLGSARELAERVLEAGGVSVRDYVRVDGSTGRGQSLLRCYGRAGQPCLRCGTTLVKSKVAGRGTTSCPGCQGGQ